MQVKCKKVTRDEDGRLTCAVVVRNRTENADTITQISLTRMRSCRPDPGEGDEQSEAGIESTHQINVELPAGATWEGMLTWDEDAINRVQQQRDAMMLVEFAHSKPAFRGFSVPDVPRGKNEGGRFNQRMQKVGWPLILLLLMYNTYSMYMRHQQQEDITESLQAMYVPSYPDGPMNSAESMMLDQSADTQNDESALVAASGEGAIDVVKRLLGQGADVDVKDNDGETALIAAAQFNLGLMYANGDGVQQDDAKAVKWYRKSADKGVAAAQSNLGLMYKNGLGVKQDDVEAVRWYRQAAEQGDAPAQSNLAVMYIKGQGVKQDDAEAARWWRKAAEQGVASAMYNLGSLYANGDGVIRSGETAADWFYKAGISYLKKADREEALRSVEQIRNLSSVLRLNVPNAFLADKLLKQINGAGGME